MHINFFFFFLAAQGGGGGGFKPPKPPPPLDPPLLPIVQSRWGMKTMGYSLLRNTNELQDFISDLHSYPVVLNIP